MDKREADVCGRIFTGDVVENAVWNTSGMLFFLHIHSRGVAMLML